MNAYICPTYFSIRMKIRFAFIFISLMSIGFCNAQDKLDAAIPNLQNNYTEEKAYLLLDKPQYVAGDDLRFKSFVFTGYQLSGISTTLFVELFNQNKTVVDRRTILLQNGQGNGDFPINKDLPEGMYFLRAYTPWMTNFPEKFQTIVPVAIYNPTSKEKLVKNNSSHWTIGAFPEGGNLIAKIPSKIAVRLFTDNVPPKSWEGFVSEVGKPAVKLASFKNLDQNVAVFQFTPEVGKKYQVTVIDEKGQKQTSILPEVQPSGVHLEVSQDEKGIHFTLKETGLAEGLKDYKIVGTLDNNLAYKANIKAPSPSASSTIPIAADQGLNGIIQISVLSPDNQPVAQRLVFVNPKKLNIAQPDIQGFSNNVKPRGFNSFDLIPNNHYSDFTVLIRDVFDPSEPDPLAKNNLLSFLWLTSDLKSPIYAPVQYFTQNSNATALDAILLSEKWTRWDWSDLLAGKKPLITQMPGKYLSYSGLVRKGGRPLPNTPVNILLKSKEGSAFKQYTTDADGYIKMNDVFLAGAVTASYYLNSKGDAAAQNLNIAFTPITKPNALVGPLPETPYRLVPSVAQEKNPSVTRALQSLENKETLAKNEIQIAPVEIQATKKDPKEELNKELATGMFNSMNSTILDLVNENQDAQAYTNIFQWMTGKVAGVQISPDGQGNYTATIRGQQAKIYLDEVPIDPSQVKDISVSNIAMVKVIKDSGLLGNAIAIYTKRGDMKSATQPKNEMPTDNFAVLNGYSIPNPFILPDVAGDSYKKITDDTREVLFWNPEFIVSNGNAPTIKFFNNDHPGNLQIIVISFDKDSNPMYYDGPLQ